MRLILLTIFSLSLSTPLFAQAPLSAIEWLSESIKHPPEFTIPPAEDHLVPPTFMDITVVTGLSPVSSDAIGLLSPELTGFSADLWGDMRAIEIATMVAEFQNEGLPEAKNLFRRILLAQTNPAMDDTQSGLILQSRIQKLFEIGALDAAEALVTLDTGSNPELFAQMFDIAILTQRTIEVCKILQKTPAISDDLSTRVYCLARSGDWNAAAITLSLAGTIGEIDPAREEMLIRFLDPELFVEEPDPAIPDPLTVMDFVLREAVFLPRPAGHLPLPYLYRDIGSRAPQRAKMEASERLVKAGSMPSDLLFDAYREGKAAVSGGVWGRANAVQELDAALAENNEGAVLLAVENAVELFAINGLTTALAQEFAGQLAGVAHGNTVNELLLLNAISVVDGAQIAPNSPSQELALAILDPTLEPPKINGNAMLNAIANGLWSDAPDTPTANLLAETLASGRQGAAILSALELLANGALSDPESIRAGLYTLREAGQEDAAKRLAIQILLLPQGI